MHHAPQEVFMGLPPELCRYPSARYVVLPVPYEGTVSYAKGTGDGPKAIITASRQVEWFDEELEAEFVQAGIATADYVEPAKTVDEQMARVKAAAVPHVQAGKFLLTLGGEHGITPPLVAAVAQQYGEVSVLQIDAHADLRDSYHGGKNSHACAMRRVLEITPRIAQVGIRNWSLEEHQACPEQVRNFITPRVVAHEPDWIERTLALLGPRVYLTVDIDGLDPAEAPGTGTPEPGGIHWPDVTALLRRLCVERTVVAADIVEVRPIPFNYVTDFLAARLAYKIVAYTQGH